jgi:outer membrane receptor protein involved in Fe transport
MPVLSALTFTVATAAAAAAQPNPGSDGWQWRLEGAALHQFETSLDSGGDMSAQRFFASAGASRMFADRWRVGAAIGYGEDRYDFAGATGFGALDPWDRIRELRLSMSLQYFAGDAWTFYAIPSLRFNAESGASLSDGQTVAVLAGAAYRVSDRLSIGPGLGVSSELEDDVSVFPILLIDWQISDTLSLETGGGFAASRGPGLQLRWRYSPRWQFALGARYEKTRFRLDDDGPAVDGVGEDKAIPIYALAEFNVTNDTALTFIGGAEVGASLRLEDASGALVSDSDLSTAPFFGALLRTRF